MTSIREIQESICAEYQVTLEQLLSPSRRAKFVKPRHIAMQRARAETTASFPKIARAFNRRNHTTVLKALRKLAHG